MKKTLFSIATVTALTGVAAGNVDAAAYGGGNDSSNTNTTEQTSTTSVSNYESYSYTYDENGYDYSYGNEASEQTTEQQTTEESYEAPAVQEEVPAVEEYSAPAPEVQEESQAPAPQVQESTATNSNAASVAQSVASGKSYVYGGNSASAVDCSALTQQFMQQFEGKDIPRTAAAQKAAGTQTSNPQPGDLVFFNDGSHVGIYIGNGQMIDALNPSEGVGERSVSYVSGNVDGYYSY